MTVRGLTQRCASIAGSAWPDVLCVLVLVAAVFAHLSSLERVLDLPSWDEADYVRMGVGFPAAKLPSPEWGPLYALWYAALAPFTDGPVSLFYGSYRLSILLGCLGIYACVRRFKGPPAIALCGSLGFLFAFAPHIVPRSSVLALIIVLTGVALFARVRTFATFAMGLSLTMLVAAWARPESFLAFALASAVMWGAIAWRSRLSPGRWRRHGAVLGVWAVAVAALLFVGGNPMSDRTNRRLYAFCQHFALGEVTRSKLPLDPWGQCNEVVERSFGKVSSLGEAMRTNPRAFAAHVRDNAISYPATSMGVFLSGFGAYGMGQPQWSPVRSAHVAVLGFIALGALIATWRSIRARRWRGALTRFPVRAALVALVAVSPTAASALLIWPREHYLVLQGVAVCLLVVSLLRALQPVSSARLRQAQMVAVGIVVVVLVTQLPQLELRPVPGHPLATAKVVEAIAGAPSLQPASVSSGRCTSERISIFEAQGGYDAYLGPCFTRVSPAQVRPGEPLRDFLERTKVRLVVIEDALVNHHALARVEGLDAFVKEPEAFGFRVTPVAGTDRRIAWAGSPRSRVAQPSPTRGDSQPKLAP